MLFDFIRRRLEELRDGLEELKRQQNGEYTPGNLRVPGQRRTAPIYVRGDPNEPLPSERDAQSQPAPKAYEELHLPLTSDSGDEAQGHAFEVNKLRDSIREPGRLKEAFVLREILDRPIGLRRPARRSFRDR